MLRNCVDENVVVSISWHSQLPRRKTGELICFHCVAENYSMFFMTVFSALWATGQCKAVLVTSLPRAITGVKRPDPHKLNNVKRVHKQICSRSVCETLILCETWIPQPLSRSHLSRPISNGWALNQNPLATDSNDLLDTNGNFLVATHPQRNVEETRPMNSKKQQQFLVCL